MKTICKDCIEDINELQELQRKNIKESYKKCGMTVGRVIGLLDQDNPPNKKSHKAEKVREIILSNLSDDSVIGITLTIKYLCKLGRFPMDQNITVRENLLRSRKFAKFKYILVPEFSKQGRLHYHGIFYEGYYSDYVAAIEYWRKKYGFVKGEFEIKYPEKWANYCCKDINKTFLPIIHQDKIRTTIRRNQFSYDLDELNLPSTSYENKDYNKE